MARLEVSQGSCFKHVHAGGDPDPEKWQKEQEEQTMIIELQ